MKNSWFRPLGIFYRPITWQAWIITLLALAFCIQVFVFVDSQSHSASDTLYGIFPFVVPTFLLWVWIAGQTSSK